MHKHALSVARTMRLQHFFYSLAFKPKPSLIVNGSTWGPSESHKVPGAVPLGPSDRLRHCQGDVDPASSVYREEENKIPGSSLLKDPRAAGGGRDGSGAGLGKHPMSSNQRPDISLPHK